MIEKYGRTYQIGNGTPNNAKKVLRSLCKDGMTKGSVYKGAQIDADNLVEGTIRSRKEYYFTFTELSSINPDAILCNKYDELIFLYEI